MKTVVAVLALVFLSATFVAATNSQEAESALDSSNFEEGVRGRAKALEKLDSKTSKTNKEIPPEELEKCKSTCKRKFRFFDLKHCPVDERTLARCARLVCKFKKNKRSILKNVVKVYLAGWTKRQRICLKVRKCTCSTKVNRVCLKKGKRVIKFTNRCMAKCYLHRKQWSSLTACSETSTRPPRKTKSCAHCYNQKRKCVFSLFSLKRYYNKCEARCRGVRHVEPCTTPKPTTVKPEETPEPTRPKTKQERAVCREEVAAVCLPRCVDTCRKGLKKHLGIVTENTILRKNKAALKDGKCPKPIPEERLAKIISSARDAGSHDSVMKKLTDCVWDCTKMCYADPDLEVVESISDLKSLTKSAPVAEGPLDALKADH